jgi:sulfide:quinone oxidoreductase
MTSTQVNAEGGPLRVVVAGAGIAGLEALLALRALAGARVQLTLVAPDDEFVYRPLAMKEPFAVGRARRIALDDAARDADAFYVAATVEAVDAKEKVVTPSVGRQLEYDALVLAVGAETVPVIANAMTWDDRADHELLGGLLQDIEEGYSRRLAVVIPPGPGWPLRAYELAVFITLRATDMSMDLRTTIIAPQPSPLEALGSRAVELIGQELAQAGVEVVPTIDVQVEQGHAATVVLQPSGQHLEVDRVLALPGLRGRPIPGIPANTAGFLEIDEHCRVGGLDGVWAAGDGTAFALKSGGCAAEQADVSAEDIAAMAGAAVDPHPFDPRARGQLAGLPDGRFLKAWLSEGGDDGLTTGLPATGVPTLTYLQRDLAASRRY